MRFETKKITEVIITLNEEDQAELRKDLTEIDRKQLIKKKSILDQILEKLLA